MLIRLEEKINNLESENQVLRQQAVSMAPNKFLSGRSRSIIQVLLGMNLIYMVIKLILKFVYDIFLSLSIES
jgi:hypothetical protein